MPFQFDPGLFKRFTGKIELAQQLPMSVALQAVEAFAEAAEQKMIQVMTEATTPTGEARYAAGGNGPGRIDTGRMVRAIVADFSSTGNVAIGRAGWLEIQDAYFLIQDQSERYGAHALEQAYQAGFNAAILVIERRWVRGGKSGLL